VFLITLMLVNMSVFNVTKLVNSCKLMYILKMIVNNKLDLLLTSTIFVHLYLLIFNIIVGKNTCYHRQETAASILSEFELCA
jgi:hypothetical protein